jgi:PAS domain-containing protein
MPDADSLYREICGICVEHGHASIAYVSLVQGSALVQVASAGPAARFLANLKLLAGADGDSSTGLSGVAARTGSRQITNDCKADPRTAPWRGATAHLGTKSVAAFPFRREGRTVGTLTLHMTIEGLFDERVIELVDEMTEDMSFALDNFAREEARSNAERQAKSDAERFRMLFQTAPVSMTIDTLEDRELLDANEAYARLLGEDPSTQAGRPAFDDRLWSGDAERAFVGHLRSHGQVRNFELRRPDGPGKERDYLLQADFIEFANRPCVLTIANEITDLRDAQRRVASQERQLSGLVDTAMDAIISIDATFRIKLFNRAAGELFLLAPEEALGSPIDRFVPNRLRAAHADHIERFKKDGKYRATNGGSAQPGGSTDRRH